MMSRITTRGVKRTQRTAVYSGSSHYDKGPDLCYDQCRRGVVDGWKASNFLEDVKAVTFNNELCKAIKTEDGKRPGRTHPSPSGGWESRGQSQNQCRRPDASRPQSSKGPISSLSRTSDD